MGVVTCQVCQNQMMLTRKDTTYLFDRDDFICSAQCLLTRIHNTERQELSTTGIRWFTETEMRNQRAERQVWSRDLNEFFRSEWELIIAGFLSFIGIPYIYEGVSISIGKRHYIPDFLLTDNNLFLEVKGLWLAGSKAKMRKIQKQREDIRFLVVPWVLRKSILEYLNAGTKAAK